MPSPKPILPSTCPKCGYHQLTLHEPALTFRHEIINLNEYEIILYCPYCRKDTPLGVYAGVPDVKQ